MPRETPRLSAGPGSSVWTWTFSMSGCPTTTTELANAAIPARGGFNVDPFPLDKELGAVAVQLILGSL